MTLALFGLAVVGLTIAGWWLSDLMGEIGVVVTAILMLSKFI